MLSANVEHGAEAAPGVYLPASGPSFICRLPSSHAGQPGAVLWRSVRTRSEASRAQSALHHLLTATTVNASELGHWLRQRRRRQHQRRQRPACTRASAKITILPTRAAIDVLDQQRGRAHTMGFDDSRHQSPSPLRQRRRPVLSACRAKLTSIVLESGAGSGIRQAQPQTHRCLHRRLESAGAAELAQHGHPRPR